MTKVARNRLWMLWFALLFVLAYSPLASPYGRTGQVFGLPLQLLIWFALTLVLAISISVFAIQYRGGGHD